MNQQGAEQLSVLARALPGVAASIFASVPLTVAYSMYGFVSSPERLSVAYALVATFATVLFALPISAVASVVLGIPVYAITMRTRAPRAATLILAGSIGGVVVLALLDGVDLVNDIESVVVFGFFGASSGAAFWFGAERWSHAK